MYAMLCVDLAKSRTYVTKIEIVTVAGGFSYIDENGKLNDTRFPTPTHAEKDLKKKLSWKRMILNSLQKLYIIKNESYDELGYIVSFLGELYKKDLVKAKVVLSILSELLKDCNGVVLVQRIEIACRLIASISKQLTKDISCVNLILDLLKVFYTLSNRMEISSTCRSACIG